MKIFVLGPPHVPSAERYSTCAFATLARNLCRMLTDRDHEVVHLGVEGSDPTCSEHVSVVSRDLWERTYGDPGSRYYDTGCAGDKYRPLHDLYVSGCRRAIAERTSRPWESVVCMTWGDSQRDVALHAGDVLHQHVVEAGVGYPHTFARNRVFHSYAWMHAVHGWEDGRPQPGQHWCDVVIPFAIDPDLFEYREEKGDYFLYLGRLQDDKGVDLACQVAERTGTRIIIAGQGDPEKYTNGRPLVEAWPPAGVAERRELLAGARALLCPTLYVEPFGAVAVEAQTSGTPVICTDWGGFVETVLHGTTGYRCRTFDHFLWAAGHAGDVDPRDCRRWSENYHLQKIAPMYEEYFSMLLDRSDGCGWYAEHPGRCGLDWLHRILPREQPGDNHRRTS